MFMDLYSLTEFESNNLMLFNQGVIDHAYIKHEDDLNYYLICHAFEDGTLLFNGQITSFEYLEKVIKTELNIPYEQCLFIDVISCHGLYLNPYMKNNFRIKATYSKESEIYYEFTEDKKSVIISDSPYIVNGN